MARHDTIRLPFGLAAHRGWVIHQMDVQSAFLNGTLDEEIYVEQPLVLRNLTLRERFLGLERLCMD